MSSWVEHARGSPERRNCSVQDRRMSCVSCRSIDQVWSARLQTSLRMTAMILSYGFTDSSSSNPEIRSCTSLSRERLLKPCFWARAMKSASILKMRVLITSSTVAPGYFCAIVRAYSGVTPWTRSATSFCRVQILEAGCFHAVDKRGSDLKDPIGDRILDRLHLEPLLLELGDGFGRDALNFACDQVVGAEFAEA